jgi:hypothetical protein
MPNGEPTLPWCATAFSPVFGESVAPEIGFVARESLQALRQKGIDSAKANLNQRRKSTDYRLTVMNSFFCRRRLNGTELNEKIDRWT